MKRTYIKKFILIQGLLAAHLLSAQIKHDSISNLISADEEFQINFYDALKQKGIENFNKAIKKLNDCKELFPNRAVIYYELGNIYFKIKKYSDSERNLRKAISLDNKNFWYRDKLYNLYLEQNNFDKAIEELLPILNYNRHYEENLSYLYTNTGRYNEALSHIQFMDDHYGYNLNRDQLRIKIYKQTSDQGSHIEFLKQRLDSNSEDSNNFINLIYALSEYGLEKEAYNTALSFLDLYPKSHIPHVALYKFYLNQKDYDGAINSMKIVTESNVLPPIMKLKVLKDFIDFVKKNPSYSDVLLSIEPSTKLINSDLNSEGWGDYFLEKKQLEKANYYYKKAFEESSQDVNIIKKLANIYLKTKQYNKALEFSFKHLELFPTQIELYLIYGKSQFYLQNWADAIEVMEQGSDYIFEDNNISLEYYELMFDLYNKNNNSEKAKEISDMIQLLKS